MRFPGSKIYRAFPELDRFSDERCARFVAAATWNGGWFLLRWVGLALVFLLTLFVWSMVLAFIHGFLNGKYAWVRHDPWMVIVAADLCSGMFVPAMATMVVRDILLRHRIKLFIGQRGTCECGYVLLGLPVSANLIVICPECGADTKVDVAMGELVMEGDVRRFKPAEGGGL